MTIDKIRHTAKSVFAVAFSLITKRKELNDERVQPRRNA